MKNKIVTQDNVAVLTAITQYFEGNIKAISDFSEVTLLTVDAFKQVLPGILKHGQDSFFSNNAIQCAVNLATSRQGHVAIVKYDTFEGGHFLMCSARPFVAGDHCDGTRDSEMYYLLGLFLNYTLEHPERFPDFPKTREQCERFYLEAYPDRDKSESLIYGKRILNPEQILSDLNYDESYLVQYDPNWPVEQIEDLLCSTYDMNHRSLVDWLHERLETQYPDIATSFGMKDLIQNRQAVSQ